MAVPNAAKVVTFEGFKRVVTCVAGVALCDFRTGFITCQKSFRVTGAILWHRFPKMGCNFRDRSSALGVSCCVFCASRFVRAASSGGNVKIAWQAWGIVRVSFCVAGAIFATLCAALHFTLRTLHFTLYTPHFTLHTLHSTPYTIQSTLRTSHFTLDSPHSTLYTAHLTLQTLHFTLCTSHFTLDTPHSTHHALHFTLDT